MIHIDLKADGGAEIKKYLKSLPDNLRARALKNALNATAREALKVIWRDTQRIYAAKQHIFKSSKNKKVKIQKATPRRLESTIHINSRKTELYEFKVSPARYDPKSRPEVYRGKGILKNSLKRIFKDDNKAFIVKYNSGHVTLAHRTSEKQYPINTVHSPAISQLIGALRMQKILYPEINVILKGEVKKQMIKILNKGIK